MLPPLMSEDALLIQSQHWVRAGHPARLGVGRVLDVAVSLWTILTHEGSNPRSANRLPPRRHVPSCAVDDNEEIV